MTRRSLPLLLLCCALALPLAAAERPFTCDQNTVLTLAGADTQEGRLLFRTADGWFLEVRPDATDPGGGDWRERAAYHRAATEPPVYGTSVGPGEIFGVHACGDGCLQAVVWRAGSWEPLGGPLRSVPSGTAHATRDLSGAAWLVVQSPLAPGEGPDDGVRARAWRLEDGAWTAAGAAVVRSAGAAAAVPDPNRSDAVLSGTVRFAVGEKPQVWVDTLPALASEQVGVLVPVESGAAYLTAEGRMLLSPDGARWVRSRWVPWKKHPTRLAAPGRDYTLDLPTGDRRGPLHALWVDRRVGEGGQLHLTRWSPAADWDEVAEVEPEVTTLDGAKLGYSEIVVARPGVWVLLTGCVNTANGPGLVLRTAGAEGVTRPRFVPLRPGELPVARGGDGRESGE